MIILYKIRYYLLKDLCTGIFARLFYYWTNEYAKTKGALSVMTVVPEYSNLANILQKCCTDQPVN